MASPRTLASLPREILEEILSNIDHTSLLQCSMICWRLKTTIEESSELMYKIELGHEGMIDNASLRMPHAERLARLRDRRKAWNALDWKTTRVVSVQGLCHAYELAGGVFAKGVGGRDFFVSWLPSADAEGHEVLRDDLKINARDFAIDPGQDLIIFLEEEGGMLAHHSNQNVKLHMRSITNHEPHVQARFPVIEFSVPPHEVYARFVRCIMLQVADDIIAVLLTTWYQRLLIWNWKEGILISDSSQDGHHLPEYTADFSLISPRAYILASREGSGVIQIYAFESEAGFCPWHITTLCLPGLAENVRVRNLTTHTGPFETPLADEPFATSSTSRIHVISIQYGAERDTSRKHFHLFVHNQTFLSFVEDHYSGNSKVPYIVHWLSWGPNATRLITGLPPYTWLRYVHGQRVVCPPGLNPSVETISVLDFNVHHFHTPRSSSDEVIRQICVAPSTIPGDKLFKNAVTTRLPYFVTSRVIFERYSAYMIDAERIIGLKAKGHVDEELRELHVLAF
ncbi:hypothetical protein FPV67DRAFT_1456141 [Lyophyllum atratum]|nr:hypothetical protein FPV67DRAFT_1456141 [Lyophyllum atratum]